MIGKVVRGSNVAGLLAYLFGPGRANEHAEKAAGDLRAGQGRLDGQECQSTLFPCCGLTGFPAEGGHPALVARLVLRSRSSATGPRPFTIANANSVGRPRSQ